MRSNPMHGEYLLPYVNLQVPIETDLWQKNSKGIDVVRYWAGKLLNIRIMILFFKRANRKYLIWGEITIRLVYNLTD